MKNKCDDIQKYICRQKIFLKRQAFLRCKFHYFSSILALKFLLIGAIYSVFAVNQVFSQDENHAPINLLQQKKALISGDPAEQVTAMDVLGKGGTQGTEILLDVMKNEREPAIQSRVIQSLQINLSKKENRTPEVLSRLQNMSKNEDPRLVELSVRGLEQYKGDSNAQSTLKNIAKTSPDPQVRVLALGSLVVNVGHNPSEIPFVDEFLGDPSEYVQVSAAGYLGSLGSENGLNICKMVLGREPKDDSTIALQSKAATAAGKIKSKSLLPLLNKISSSDKYGYARSSALSAIKEIELNNLGSDQEKLDYLKRTLSEPDSTRWALNKLVKRGDAKAIEVLKWAAAQENFPAAIEANRALTAVGVK